jgi:hypothetical protein
MSKQRAKTHRKRAVEEIYIRKKSMREGERGSLLPRSNILKSLR